MQFETLLYEREDGVAVLTLNRPERHNAFDWTMADELGRAWQAIKRDPAVRCVIVTGAGDEALSTGVDVASVAADGGFEQAVPDEREPPPFLRMTALKNECWKPVVTAVNGAVCGGGFHFVADSDLVVCAEHATFFDTHVKLGTISGLEAIVLSRRLPLESVLRLALLGGVERMDAKEALRIGLVGEVVPRARLMPRARELAHAIAAHSPTALARSKRAIWRGLDRGLQEALAETWSVICAHTHHPDQAEGTRALLEKRAPRWAPYLGD